MAQILCFLPSRADAVHRSIDTSLRSEEKVSDGRVQRRTTRILLLLAFWTSLVLCAWLLGRWTVVAKALSYGQSVPVRAHPAQFVTGLSMALFCLVTSIVAVYLKQAVARTVCAILIPVTLLCVGVVVASIQPSDGALNIRDERRATPQEAGSSVYAFVVLFPNGVSAIPSSEQSRVTDFVNVFRSCGDGQLLVRGFASSAPFRRKRDNSNRLNLDLANERAVAVTSLIESITGVPVQQTDQWTDYLFMDSARRIRDVNTKGYPILEAERLNRRVEVYWTTNICGQPANSSQSELVASG